MSLEAIYEQADKIGYDFFSVEAITNHLKLKEEYGNNFTDEEIIRLEVQHHMIRTMDEEELFEYMKRHGFERSDMKKLKEIHAIEEEV